MVDSDGDLHECIYENDSSGDYYDDAPIDEKNDNNIDDNNEFFKAFQKQNSFGNAERSD